MVKYIGKQWNMYTLLINDIRCNYLPPKYLFIGSDPKPHTPFVPKNKSVLLWKVKGKQISYNQIREAIKRQ